MNNTTTPETDPHPDEVARAFFGIPPAPQQAPESDEDAAARKFFGLAPLTDDN